MPLQKYRWVGVTLIEIILVMAMLGVIAGIAYPSYTNFMRKSDIKIAIGDIKMISFKMKDFFVTEGRFPNDFAEIGGAPTDPWGNPYQYLNISLAVPGQLRKDKNLNPINSDFDLYSMGEDGQTQKQLTAAKARDDIVRANNGGFVGLAEDH